MDSNEQNAYSYILCNCLLVFFIMFTNDGNSNLSMTTNDTYIQSQDVCTTGGDGGGRPCAFPFEYGGTTHHGCTSADSDQDWCYVIDPDTGLASTAYGNCVECPPGNLLVQYLILYCSLGKPCLKHI